MDTVQGGGQHQFGARQKQAEGDLLGTGGTCNVAGAAPETQGRCVGGNQAQDMPTWAEAVGIGAFDEPVVKPGNSGRRELGAGLGKRLLGNVAYQLRLLLEVREEFVKFGLNAFTHAGEHDRD